MMSHKESRDTVGDWQGKDAAGLLQQATAEQVLKEWRAVQLI